MVDARLGRKDGKEPIAVGFLLDTGAYRSLLSLREIHRLGVSVHELRRSVGTAIVFGGRAQLYSLTEVTITFDTDQGEHPEHLPQVLTAIGPATGEHRKRPPVLSLLGRDVLDRFAVVIDKRAGIVLLKGGSFAPGSGLRAKADGSSRAERQADAIHPEPGAKELRSGRIATMRDVRVPILRAPEGEGLPYPEYATAGSAGVDLRAAVDAPVTIAPGERRAISTGIRVAIPEGYEGQVRPRSGLARDHGVTMVNSPGTVDSDFRGTLQALLINLGQQPFTVERGYRIGQLVLAPVARIDWEPVEALPETQRGEGGFGHTGRG
jgi:dUTP pyrophosphatase